MADTRAATSPRHRAAFVVACLLAVALAAGLLRGGDDAGTPRPVPAATADQTAATNAAVGIPAERRPPAATDDTGTSASRPAPIETKPIATDRDAAIAAALQRMRDAEEHADAAPVTPDRPPPAAPARAAITLEPEVRASLEAKALAD